jgi:hypothetical protein
MALKNTMIKNQIDKVVLIADQYSFLACFKAEAVPQFKEKIFKLVDKQIFELRFSHDLFGFQPDKFKQIGIADIKERALPLRLLVSKLRKLLLVAGQAGTFIVEGESAVSAHAPSSFPE